MSVSKAKLWEIVRVSIEGSTLLSSGGGGAMTGCLASWVGLNQGTSVALGIFAFIGIIGAIIYRQHYRLIPTGIVARRAEIERVYPLDRQYTEGHHIRACFLTGLDGFQRYRDVLKKHKIIEQIILPHPKCEYLKDLRKSQGDAAGSLDFAEDIKEATRMALERKIDVRWYPHFCGMSFLLGLERSNGRQWAHIETVLPYIAPPERLVIRLDSKREERAITDLSETFKEMWKYCGKDVVPSDLA